MAMADLASDADPRSIQGLVYRDGHEIADNGWGPTCASSTPCHFPPTTSWQAFQGRTRAHSSTTRRRLGRHRLESWMSLPVLVPRPSVYRRASVFNSAEYLYEHVAFLKKGFGIRHVFFYDDLFTSTANASSSSASCPGRSRCMSA